MYIIVGGWDLNKYSSFCFILPISDIVRKQPLHTCEKLENVSRCTKSFYLLYSSLLFDLKNYTFTQ